MKKGKYRENMKQHIKMKYLPLSSMVALGVTIIPYPTFLVSKVK